MSTFLLQNDLPKRPSSIDYAQQLNQEQLDVVFHGDGPCLVLAGAGSGKTRTITYRVAYLIEQGVDPSSIVLMTFTNKAAREMTERITQVLGAEARGLVAGTFHSIAHRLLRPRAGLIGYRDGFTILDQDDGKQLIKSLMKELSMDDRTRHFPSPAVVQNLFSFAANTLDSLEGALEMKNAAYAAFSAELEELRRQFYARKRSANAMDFDDLLLNFLALLELPEGEHLAQRFHYVLVDEYQDTNALQAAIVKRLSRQHQNVLVVGDDAQSIYAFRGADVKNILSFPEQWSNTKIFKLLTNYRSTPEILDVANDSLSHNAAQFQKDLVGLGQRGRRPLLVPASSARQEAQYIMQQIQALQREGLSLRNIAVLFRSSAHSQLLEFELVRHDLPYEYRGGMKFFGRAHVKDALAYLRVLSNPQDETAWWRVLGMQPGIGATTAAKLTHELVRVTTFEQALIAGGDVHLSARALSGWQEARTLFEAMMHVGNEPAPLLQAILKAGYRDYLEREYPDARDRLEDLEQLIVFAGGYHDLPTFLADIALYDEATNREGQAGSADTDRVVLSTIHQAKGLEWEAVFVMHLAEDMFPSRYASSEDDIEEERRLFYVAITRARKRLFLTYPLTVGGDDLSFRRPSLFLSEVSPRLLERLEIREAPRYGGSSLSHSARSALHAEGDEEYRDSEETIVIHANGERSAPPVTSKTVWKSSSDNKKILPTSFLRDI